MKVVASARSNGQKFSHLTPLVSGLISKVPTSPLPHTSVLSLPGIRLEAAIVETKWFLETTRRDRLVSRSKRKCYVHDEKSDNSTQF